MTYAETVFCSFAWDSLLCWPPTLPGQTIHKPCPSFRPDQDILERSMLEKEWLKFFDRKFTAEFRSTSKYQFQASWLYWYSYRLQVYSCTFRGIFASRTCNAKGEWLGNKTDFSECLQYLQENDSQSWAPLAVAIMLLVGSFISIITLSASLFIFLYFRSLRCNPSLRIHVQLFTALVLQGTSMSMATAPLLLPQYTQPAWLCLFLVFLQMYSGLSSTNWMFIEGLHLHSRLTSRVFQKEAPLAAYHILGWGIPFICTGIWFSLMSRLNATTTSNECWSGYGRSLIIWIITGPMMAALTVNSLFLIDIIRILISKRMSSNRTTSETEQLRKAVKATALLFPLLGIPHLLFCINPGGDGAWEEAYMFANATLKSSQGFFVSILYCFMNAEVQITLKKAYMRCLSRRNCTRSGTSRQTSTTYVTSQSDTKKSVTTAL